MTSSTTATTNPLFQGFEAMFGTRDAASGKAVFSLNPLTKKQSQYLQKVYTLMTLGIVAAMAACLYGPSIPPYMAILTQMGLIMYISGSRFRENHLVNPSIGRPAAFFAMCGIVGSTIKPLVEYANIIDPSLIATAGIAALAIFFCLSFASVLNFQSRSFLYLASSISSATLFLALVKVANWWLRSRIVFDMVLLVEFGLTLAYTLFDTQMALASVSMGQEDTVSHALMFFINLVNLFVKILTKLSESKQDEKEEKNERRKKR